MRVFTIKNLVILSMLLCMGTATCSCGNPKKAIKKVAYSYLDAMANYRIDDAEPFCTKETHEGVLTTGRHLMKTADTSFIAKDTPAKVKITKVELTSDTTAIVYFRKTTPIKKQNGHVDVVLRDGQWKVHILLAYQKRKASNNSNPAVEEETERSQEEGEVNHQAKKFPAKKASDIKAEQSKN